MAIFRGSGSAAAATAVAGGIDDNSDATAITINSDESVTFASDVSVPDDSWYGWGDDSTRIYGNATSDTMAFLTNSTTALTIDSSQNATFAGSVTVNGSDGVVTQTSGTFTPTLQDLSFSDSESQSYLTQVGRYTRIGDVVHFTIFLELNGTGLLNSSDSAFIANLPFACENVTNAYYAVSVGNAGSLLISPGESVTGFIEPGTTRIALQLWDNSNGTTSLRIDEITTTLINFMVTGFYVTDE